MSAAKYTAMVVEALAGPVPSVSDHFYQQQKGGYSTASSTTQRNAAPRDFMIPNQVMALTISWPARLVLSEVINLQKVNGQVWANDNHFVERCKVSKRTVGLALKELEAAGFLHRKTCQSAHHKRIITPLLLLTKPCREDAENAQCLMQDLPEPIANPATELRQKLPQPLADSADINTTLNSSLKSNQILLIENRKSSTDSDSKEITVAGLDAATSFEQFWNSYGKKQGRHKCSQKWQQLSQADRSAILAHVPSFVAATPDIQYRKNPLTYLSNFTWLDEELPTQGSAASLQIQKTSSPIATNYSLPDKLEKQRNSFLR